MVRFRYLLWLAPLFALGCAKTRFGGAEIFGGGNPRLTRVRSIRENVLVPTVRDMLSAPENEALCDLNACPENFCRVRMSSPQKTYCSASLRRHAPALLEKLLSPEVSLQVTEDPAKLQGKDGATQRSATGVIWLRESFVEAHDDWAIAALMIHEFFHKLRRNEDGPYFEDDPIESPYSQADGGSDLLTGKGAAVALRAYRRRQDLEGRGRLELAHAGPANLALIAPGQSVSRTFTLTNVGRSRVTDIQVRMESPFTATAQCPAQGLDPDGTCHIVVGMNGGNPGDRVEETLLITYFDSGEIRTLERVFSSRTADPALWQPVASPTDTMFLFGVRDIDGNGSPEVLRRHFDGNFSYLTYRSGQFSSNPLGRAPAPLDLCGNGDFNGDGLNDYLFRSPQAVVLWLVRDGEVYEAKSLGAPDSCAMLYGAHDFDGDTNPDPVFVDCNGEHSIWFTDGNAGIREKRAYGNVGNHRPAGFGDFDGDGTMDILWTTGNYLYYVIMRGGQAYTSVSVYFGTSTPLATFDFNGDGRSDILWKTSDDRIYLRLPSSEAVSGGFSTIRLLGQSPASAGLPLSLVGVWDMNGDGMKDILWNTGDGWIRSWELNPGGPGYSGGANIGYAGDFASGTAASSMDLDGDGKPEILVSNPYGWSPGPSQPIRQKEAWFLQGSQIREKVILP